MVADTPTVDVSKLTTVARSSSAQRTVFSTTSVLTVLQEIMTETWFSGWLSNEACGRSIMRSKLVNSEVNMVNSEVNI